MRMRIADRGFILLVVALGVSTYAQSVPEIAYDANADILALPSFGEVAGVATNSRGHVFVYARTGHAVATLGDERTFYHNGSRIFQFDQAGKFVKEIGQGVYAVNFAQQIRVDPQDNVWIVDSGSNQVVKFDADGRFQLVLGRKPENINVRPGPGVPASGGMPAEGAASGGRGGEGGRGGSGRGGGTPGTGINGDNFSRPSDVAWDRAGNIYIADGIGTNNRIAKFDKDGHFLKQWGSTGTEPGQFNGVKALAVDAQGNVYAADAGNKRIQVFDAEGTFKSQFSNIGTPLTMCMTRGSTQYLYVSHAGDEDGMEDAAIYKVALDGKVLGKFGSAGKMPKEFGLANSIDCRNENELLIGEMTNWRVQRVTLK